MFEIKEKDIGGRIGIIKVKDKKLETPYLFPVINPFDQTISVKEIEKEFKLKGIMTNAYIIYKRKEAKEKVLKEGIHDFLDFSGIIETDSGSYQMLHYKKNIEIENKEIVEFQIKIGSDIINVLDIPTDIDSNYEKALKDLEITLERIKEGIEIKNKLNFDGLINGAIQGGIYIDLRKKAAKEVSKLDTNIFAIGTIVPYMINYEFKKLFELIMESRIHLPLNKPVHLFGLGHPLILPLSAAIGSDLFDSASYSLYAKDKRYMTPFRTLRIEKMKDVPCTCPICSKYSLKEIREDVKLIAKHNLWILVQEIRAIKESIRYGTLHELLILKAHSHPSVYYATRFVLEKYYEWLKKLDPIRKKSGVLYQGELTKLRIDVKKSIERMKERIDVKDFEDLYQYTYPFNQFEPKKKIKDLIK